MLFRMDPAERRAFKMPWLGAAAVVVVATVVTLLTWPTRVDGALVTMVEAIQADLGIGSRSEAIHLARFLANVVLFVPLALIVGLATRRWWIGLLAGVAASALSEFVQRSLPGRVPSIEDLVANAFGAAIGAVVVLAVQSNRRRGEIDGRSAGDA
jgi:VanZ like family